MLSTSSTRNLGALRSASRDQCVEWETKHQQLGIAKMKSTHASMIRKSLLVDNSRSNVPSMCYRDHAAFVGYRQLDCGCARDYMALTCLEMVHQILFHLRVEGMLYERFWRGAEETEI